MKINEQRLQSFHQILEIHQVKEPKNIELLTKLQEEFLACCPQVNFDGIAIAKADTVGIVTPFEAILEESFLQNKSNGGDEFLATQARKGLETIYIVKSAQNSVLAEKDPVLWKNFQPDVLDGFIHRLEALLEKLDQEYSVIGSTFRTIYGEVIQKQIDFCINAKVVGTPEYTVGQRSSQQWRTLINIGKSEENGEVVLKYEELARMTLERGMKVASSEMKVFHTIADAFDFWKFSASEREKIIGVDEKKGDVLTPTQGKRFFEVLLHERMGFRDWIVKDNANSKAINIDVGVIEYPVTRTLTPDEMVFLPPHEIGVHVLTSVNGGLQQYQIFKSGTPDHSATQEGLAAVSEMIAGEPFGHPRQRLFAARYLAAAMALKTTGEEGNRQPKHSLQEIYNTLRSYNILAKDAAQTVWRLTRSTSLTRQVVALPISDGFTLSIAETYAKDVLYFEGFMQIRDFIMKTVPLLEKEVDEQGKVFLRGKEPQDFSRKFLARVGRAVALQGVNLDDREKPMTLGELKSVYNAYISLGRDALMQVLQFMLPGKLRLEEMVTGSPLNEMLTRNGLVQFKKLFDPTAE